MREEKIEAYLIRRVEETGGITRKVQWIGRRGAPDRLVGWAEGDYLEARHAYIELKRPLTPHAEAHQKREHDKLRSIGIRVELIPSKEDVDKFIEEMTK